MFRTKVLLISLALVMIGFGVQSAMGAMVLEYSFDWPWNASEPRIVDTSGYSNDGTRVSCPDWGVLPQYAANTGPWGDSAAFTHGWYPAQGHGIDSGGDSSLDTPDDYTISFVWQANNNPDGRGDSLVWAGSQFIIQQAGAYSNKLVVYHYGEGGGFAAITGNTAFSSGWHHVVVQFVEGVGLKLWVDNVVEGTSTACVAGNDTTAYTDDMVWGTRDGANQYYQGIFGGMDEIRLFNTALTRQEIGALYWVNDIPEPATLVMFGIGGLLMARRRRR